MKKIPTLFRREFDNHVITKIYDEVLPELQWVLEGEGIATIKWDGACSAIINGELYKRYDAKKGKPVPEGAIKCQAEPDLVTGHFPCWVKCDKNHPGDKWFWAAYDNTLIRADGTYEAIGPHFQGNPYGVESDILKPHGKDVVVLERSFRGIQKYLEDNEIEGIVFWKDEGPQCKIKRKDFGFRWR